MPLPWKARNDRALGPIPFTSEWINDPQEPPRPRRLAGGAATLPLSVPTWLPSERLLTALLVLALVCATALAAGENGKLKIAASTDSPSPAELDLARGVGGTTAVPGSSTDAPSGAGEDEEAGSDGAGSSDRPGDGAAAGEADEADAEAEPTATAEPTSASLNIERPTSPPADGSILPYYRVVSYYGQPHNSSMGILGEYAVNDDIAGLHAALQEQAAEFELVDPSRPVKLAFEVIATVAQGDAMSDGSWLLSTDDPTIQEFVDYAAEHDMLVILDVQIGRRGVPGELELIRHWLEHPHVHLALDPEFAMAEGEIPGEHIGQIDAADVLYAQQFLAEITAEHGLPPKILIVHQFHYTMIKNKADVRPYPGVQLVIDMDGHGPPPMKYETYGVMNTQHPIEFNGIKLFYEFDQPILTPEEVVALDPIPDVVIYQ